MSKNFLFLVILAGLLLFCSVTLIIMSQQLLSRNASHFFNQNTSPSPILHTSVSFSPMSMHIIPGQINTIAIVIDFQENNPTDRARLIQLEISYDPNALTDVVLQPGDFFNNPTITLNLVNQKTGRISYALEASKPTIKQIRGTVAIMHFLPNPFFSGRETTLSFLPKTILRTKMQANSVATSGAKLIFVASEQK